MLQQIYQPLIDTLTYLKRFSRIIRIKENELELTCTRTALVNLASFVKHHTLIQGKLLMELTAIDRPERPYRFQVIYFILSIAWNTRIKLVTQTNDILPLYSTTAVYNCADWLEREVFDLFGIFFIDHYDLRRILTDYGFIGHPLRKDFPLTGFVDVAYDDIKKLLVYEPVEVTQSFRKFNFSHAWWQTTPETLKLGV